MNAFYTKNWSRYIPIFIIIFFVSCQPSQEEQTMKTETEQNSSESLLELISTNESGLDFNNEITETNSINYVSDEYIYNGAGVAIVDINNDGLSDIFFTGNQVENKLYLNKGNLQFEDISKKAGIQIEGWSNGVSIVDINHDGWMDIYVCRGGTLEKNPKNRANLLFINNKNETFSEVGVQYGIADEGFSLGAAFFDYDKDGDLDLYTTNYPTLFRASMQDVQQNTENTPDEFRDKLYRNNGDFTFTEVGKNAGIVRNAAHGLGVGIADLNEDGYPDIYVSNDYVSDDYYYINQQDGTFKESIRSSIKHTAQFSMGIDLADINNDAKVDIIALDMTPADNFRSKTNMASMNPEKYERWISQGMHPQVMRNVLQLNRGASKFSEIGQMAGMDKTDWSWAVIANDLDNDGLKDLYVSNGYLRDVWIKTLNIMQKPQKKSQPGWNIQRKFLP